MAETRNPKVEGVVVLCAGGGSAVVQERVTRAVSALLGISTADIFVGRQAAASIS